MPPRLARVSFKGLSTAGPSHSDVPSQGELSYLLDLASVGLTGASGLAHAGLASTLTHQLMQRNSRVGGLWWRPKSASLIR
jgi:hypothetical protein